MSHPTRWDLCWAGLDPTRGHEQAGRRPVLIVSHTEITQAIGLAAVLPLSTWREGRKVYPTEVRLAAGVGGLPSASLVLAHQVRTVSAERLSVPFGRIESPELQARIEKALALWLDLS